MKKIITAAVILAVLVSGVTAFVMLRKKDDAPSFRTEKVTRGEIKSSVTANGTVNAVTTVLVGTQVSGTIKRIYADYNSPVKKGQLLAQIDPSPFEAQVNQARANLYSAKANVAKAEAALADAKRTMERNGELLKRKLIAQSDYDTAETNWLSAKAQLDAAKGQVSQTEAATRLAETNLTYTRIVSPVNGVVISRNVDAGQTVAASFQTPTLFTIAQDLKKMQIDTSVNEADIGRIKTGQDVEFTVDAYPDTTFKGKVSQVRIAPVTVQNVVTYDVVITVDNASLMLKPGMTANVSIITAVSENALRVPNAALRFRMPSKGQRPAKGPGIWVLENGLPKRVPVEMGISDGSYTEILSGLKEGQQVITESLTKEQTGRSPFGGPRFMH
ncbi:MAG: efflux RND transporter periplasmic adaptor subunit [Nitrospiraceae bacterium]|nr:efflux RND transporter periplasmic adaptor subunit [Nitrospiraceae bacterium]